MDGGDDRSTRRRARTWLALVSLLLLLCAAAVIVAVSDAPRAAVDDGGGASPDAAEESALSVRELRDGVHVAGAAGRRRSEDPPGLNPRAEPTGVRIGGGVERDVGALEEEPDEADVAAGADVRGVTAAGAAARTQRSRGPVARGSMTDDAVGELVVTVTAAETGRPFANADVRVTPSGAPEQARRTSRDGELHFTVPAGTAYTLDVKAPGRVRVKRCDATQMRGTARVAVALERGVVIHGFVSDEKHRLRGAAVRAVALDALRRSVPYGPEPPSIEETISRRDGSYMLDCIPRGVTCALASDAQEHAADSAVIEAQPDPDYDVRQDFILDEGNVVAGVVTGADAKPVAGAMVYAVDADEIELLTRKPPAGAFRDWPELALLITLRGAATGDYDSWAPWINRAASSRDGAFRVVVPSTFDDVLLMALDAKGGRSAPTSKSQPVKTSVTLSLRGRTRAEFAVLTSKGQRAEGMVVTPFFPWERWTAPTRGPGLYGLADVDDGPIMLDVAGPAGAPGTYFGRRVDAESVRWFVTLEDGVTWRGTVADDRNSGVAGATVSMGPRSAVSSEDGTFEISGVHPDEGELTAVAPDHPSVTVAVDRRSRKPLVVKLPRAASVRIRCVLPFGAEAPGWYRVSHGGSPSASSPPDPREDRYAWGNGVVEIGDLSSRDQHCLVFVPGYEAVVRPIAPLPGITIDLGTVELIPQAVLLGVVVDEQGKPVQNARVEARPSGSEGWIGAMPGRGADTDTDGRFELRVAVPGRTIELLVSAPDFVTTPQVVDPAVAERHTVVLGRGRQFMGRWLASNGRDARAILLGPRDVEYGRVAVEPNGTFVAEPPVLPARVRIEALRGARPKVFASVDVPRDLADGVIFEIP